LDLIRRNQIGDCLRESRKISGSIRERFSFFLWRLFHPFSVLEEMRSFLNEFLLIPRSQYDDKKHRYCFKNFTGYSLLFEITCSINKKNYSMIEGLIRLD